MEKKVIFILEDEENIQKLVKYNLENAGYEVEGFMTSNALFERLKVKRPSLLLLDIMLPGSDGYTVLNRIRNHDKLFNLPIIILTAKKSELDKVLGLEMGCDDFITKPFSVRELTARVKALLRRDEFGSSKTDNRIFKYKDLELDVEKYELYKNNELLKLPLKEFKLLEMFITNPGIVFTREVLLEKIWGYDYIGETRTVDVHVRYLRKHLGDTESKYVETVRGVGYKLKG